MATPSTNTVNYDLRSFHDNFLENLFIGSLKAFLKFSRLLFEFTSLKYSKSMLLGIRFMGYFCTPTGLLCPRNHVSQRIKAECFLLAGSVFGWSFIEYILKQEGIFYNEYCSGSNNVTESDHRNHSSGPNDTLPSGGQEFCTEALSYYQSIYTWMLIRL